MRMQVALIHGTKASWKASRLACGVLLTVALMEAAGCASGGNITHNKPTFQGDTSKFDVVYAACVQERWSALSPHVRVVETPESFQVVVANTTTNVEELLVINGRPTGASVALYERFQVIALRGYREGAKACL
jgi:hypothetical protein